MNATLQLNKRTKPLFEETGWWYYCKIELNWNEKWSEINFAFARISYKNNEGNEVILIILLFYFYFSFWQFMFAYIVWLKK